MGVTVNRYPESGGRVLYWVDTVSDTVKKITFTVEVAQGHTLTYWEYSNDVTSNRKKVSVVGPGEYQYTQQYSDEDVEDHEFSAYFDGREQGEYDLFVSVSRTPAAGGQAWADPDRFEDVPVGTSSVFKLYAQANPGYVFDHWERDEHPETSSTANPWSRRSTPAAPGSYYLDYTAYFRQANTFTLTASAAPETGGTVNGLAVYTENFVEGTSVSATLSAVAAPGYAFTGWTRTSPSAASRSGATITITVTRSETWVANFTADPESKVDIPVRFHPKSTDHGRHGVVYLKVIGTGETYNLEDSKTVSVERKRTASSTTVSVTAMSDDGYRFVKIRIPGMTDITTEGEAKNVAVGYDNGIDVFWGCDRLLYDKDRGRLLHASNGKLIYCG